MKPGRLWLIVRRIWISVGLGATAIFLIWSLVAYRASPAAKSSIRSDGRIEIVRRDNLIQFRPRAAGSPVGLIFFPGALVDPIAYSPLARAVAEAGFAAYIVPLPRRGAFGGADAPELYALVDSLLRSGDADQWVIAGHSRGGVVASTVAARESEQIAGLVLIGTSHPRDVDLSRITMPVSKIVGTRDGLASRDKVEANAHLLPISTRWTWIEGGNHSQFGWYGFQPGDRRATVSRKLQQASMTAEVIALLQEAADELDAVDR